LADGTLFLARLILTEDNVQAGSIPQSFCKKGATKFAVGVKMLASRGISFI
jgi:hypothetical protein